MSLRRLRSWGAFSTLSRDYSLNWLRSSSGRRSRPFQVNRPVVTASSPSPVISTVPQALAGTSALIRLTTLLKRSTLVVCALTIPACADGRAGRPWQSPTIPAWCAGSWKAPIVADRPGRPTPMNQRDCQLRAWPADGCRGGPLLPCRNCPMRHAAGPRQRHRSVTEMVALSAGFLAWPSSAQPSR